MKIMRIYIPTNDIKAFWEHFAPMGLISLYASIGAWGGQIYLVDLTYERNYTVEEAAKIMEEVLEWARPCPL